MIFLLAGCAHKTPRETKPLNFIVISPLIKLNDAGFIHNFKNTKQIDLYSSGISLAKITIKKDQICLNNACDNELIFNKKFFAHTHHNGFFANLIDKKPIYNGANLEKTKCGFTQNLDELHYEICDGNVKFHDEKRRVKIIIKETN
jgi:hypothetical protein